MREGLKIPPVVDTSIVDYIKTWGVNAFPFTDALKASAAEDF